MAETVAAPEEKVVVAPHSDIFDTDNWKSVPTIPEPAKAPEPAKLEDDSQILDETAYLKEHFGFESIEDAKKELADLRGKASTPAEIKFANEESERVFNLIKEGKVNEVVTVLNEQRKLAEVDKLPPADIIKLNLQYQNKDKGYSSDDINDLFSETYGMPEKPEQELDETDDEYKVTLAKYEKEVQKVESRIKRDSKPAAAELLKLHKEIVLPDIPQKKVEANNDLTQEELADQKIWAENFLKSVDEDIQKFKGYESTFKDEEVELKVAYVPSEDERKELQPIVALAGTDAGAFMQKLGWVDAKGNINTAKVAEDLPFILDKQKVLNKMVSETGNKRHEASIKGIKNIDYSGNGKKSAPQLGVTPEEALNGLTKAFFV